MKILHYIPDFSEVTDRQCRMMLRMVTATAGHVESCLVTSSQLNPALLEQLQKTYNIRLVQLPRLPLKPKQPMLALSAYRELKKSVVLLQPDIVHIHGSWNPLLAMMERVARKEGYVTCVSTYGGMAPEIVNIDFFKKRFLPLMLWQGPMIRHSSSLLAIDDKEWRDISSMGLKKRVEILPSMDKQNTVSVALRDSIDPAVRNVVDPFSIALMAAYQKAIDSSYRRFLTPDEERLVERCFISATQEDAPSASTAHDTPNGDDGQQAPDINAMSLRNIFFLAYDEDIMPQLREGAIKMHVRLPQPPDIANIPRYADRKAKRRGAIRDLPLPKRRLRIPDDKVDEYQVVASIIRVQKEGLKRLTFRHKAELYNIFRDLDFDEDIVGRELSRIHLKRFTKRIQKMLHEMYNMPTGYDIF